jgi:hypothetical protein
MITSSLATGYQAADAAALLGLASVAGTDLSDLYLQPPWKLVDTFRTQVGADGPQGFVAIGPLPSSGATAAIVAIGFSWPDFIELYRSTQHVLGLPPPGLMRGGSGMMDRGYSIFYASIRKQLWSELQSAKRTVPDFQTAMPVCVTGHGPAAPLAQLAALDLQPSRVWAGQTSPATSLSAYVYSCPAFGDQEFADYYAVAVPNGYTINLQTTNGVPVDLYPSAPDASLGYALAGQTIGTSGSIPDIECPWYEREASTYAKALSVSGLRGVAANVAHTTPPRRQAPPARRPLAVGFNLARAQLMPRAVAAASVPAYNPVLSYTLALLSSIAYQRFEHPDLTSNIPSPYSLVSDIVAGDVVWGSVFMAPDTAVVAALRGTVTWQEMTQVWGSDEVSAPSWLNGDGEVLTAYSDLYSGLRDSLRRALASVNAPHQRLFLTGHCIGGALASLATLDLSLHPETNVGQVTGLYTFGAPPVGTVDFAKTFQARVGASSFQVVRPLDVIPQLVFGSATTAVTLGRSIALDGGLQDPDNGMTYHALPMYTSLLNPRSVVAPAASARSVAAPAPASWERHYQDGLAARGIRWNDVNKCLLDTADTDGRLVLGFAGSLVGVSQSHHGTRHIAVQDIVVQPGHQLVIDAPDVHVVARSLTLGPGARVEVPDSARLHIGLVKALPVEPDGREMVPPAVVVRGSDGIAGRSGVSGMSGADGQVPGQTGGSGSNGGNGQPGSSGGNAYGMRFEFDTIEGLFIVDVRGGAGGSGGSGGRGGDGGAGSAGMRGGDGGAGGTGGPGGHGGDGSVVDVTYQRLAPGALIQVLNGPAPGGEGGAGGPGGAGGRGNPDGTSGVAGAAGPRGNSGRPGQVNFREGASRS